MRRGGGGGGGSRGLPRGGSRGLPNEEGAAGDFPMRREQQGTSQ